MAIPLTLALGGASVPGCLDASPITVVTDAGAVPDAAPLSAACVACFNSPDKPGPGCGAELAICKSDLSCTKALDCALTRGCLTRGTEEALITCGLPCAADVGLTSGDKGEGEAEAVFACLLTVCGGPCHL